MFENQAAEATNGSPNGKPSGGSPESRKAKITSSFVPVDGQAGQPTAAPANGTGDGSHGSGMMEGTAPGVNGGSDNTSHSQASKQDVKSVNGSSTVPTESTKLADQAGKDVASAANGSMPISHSKQQGESEAANPDKPVSGAEVEAGSLRPADLTDTSTTSPGATKTAKPVQTPSKSTSTPLSSNAPRSPGVTKTLTPSKPLPLSTPSKALSSVKTNNTSPKSPRTPSSSTTKTTGSPSKPTASPRAAPRSDRSSLTAQTASSAARSKKPDTEAYARRAQDLKAKAKSPAKTVKQISSHLLAPTASSAARSESTKTADKPTSRSSLGSAKSTSRAPSKSSSLARSNSSATKPISKTAASTTSGGASKPATSSGGLLSRLTRPTASSAGRAHEKPEPAKAGPASGVAAGHRASLPIRSRPAPGSADGKSKGAGSVAKESEVGKAAAPASALAGP